MSALNTCGYVSTLFWVPLITETETETICGEPVDLEGQRWPASSRRRVLTSLGICALLRFLAVTPKPSLAQSLLCLFYPFFCLLNRNLIMHFVPIAFSIQASVLLTVLSLFLGIFLGKQNS
ncbi:hypothetical protein GLYMA_19G063000v4 [Glycine max]|uniref:Uncharacterized protein n=1 Tax=Glycine max TaxID=3847 RepID=A0A0R0EIK8_SOYBN|nr:hypothetical protein GYH30_052222 [Glycine max]KRG94109.1 hypothetical protein GLYMA_19G063000v4 [Glycine max]